MRVEESFLAMAFFYKSHSHPLVEKVVERVGKERIDQKFCY
jgi:hypothetical protein